MSVRRKQGTLSCVILDLDETIVNTRDGAGQRLPLRRALEARGEADRYYEFKIAGATYWGVKRPYYRLFIDFCFAEYDVVVVWTAAERDYATEIVARTFSHKPHIFWCREDCALSGGVYYKPIDRLFTKFPDLSRADTVQVDDRDDVAKYNPEYLLGISAYNYKDPLTYDRALVVAIAFLRDVNAGDVPVRDVDKRGVAW